MPGHRQVYINAEAMSAQVQALAALTEQLRDTNARVLDLQQSVLEHRAAADARANEERAHMLDVASRLVDARLASYDGRAQANLARTLDARLAQHAAPVDSMPWPPSASSSPLASPC